MIVVLDTSAAVEVLLQRTEGERLSQEIGRAEKTA